MASETIPTPKMQDPSKAFFAALLAAMRENCECNTCKILRKVADELMKEYINWEVTQ